MSLSSDLATKTTESTPLGQLLDSMRAERVDVEEQYAARNAVASFIVADFYAMPGPSVKGLVENNRAVRKKSVSEAICVGSTDPQYHI